MTMTYQASQSESDEAHATPTDGLNFESFMQPEMTSNTPKIFAISESLDEYLMFSSNQ